MRHTHTHLPTLAQGWYSVTPEVLAQHQAATMRAYGRGHVAADVMAGCGGNVIALASHFTSVRVHVHVHVSVCYGFVSFANGPSFVSSGLPRQPQNRAQPLEHQLKLCQQASTNYFICHAGTLSSCHRQCVNTAAYQAQGLESTDTQTIILALSTFVIL